LSLSLVDSIFSHFRESNTSYSLSRNEDSTFILPNNAIYGHHK